MSASPKSASDSPPLIGIVAAYRAEIAPLLHRAKSLRRAADGDIRLTLPPGEAALIISGAGSGLARAAAERLAGRNDLRALISIGVAGGLAAQMTTGSVLVASNVIDAERGTTYTCAADFSPASVGLSGTLVTVPTVITTRAGKAALHTRWQAAAADMEAAAVAEVAAARALPFAALKGITDGPADELAIDFQRCFDSRGGLSSVKILLEGLRGPAQFRSLLMLARNSRSAADSLAQALVGLMSR
jgi:nucleoside phosphorylase